MNLVVRNLTIYRDQELVLNDISFSAGKGQVIGIIGDNGVGKTTLLQALMRNIPIYSGEISSLYYASVEQDLLLSYTGLTVHEWLGSLEDWQIAYLIQIADIEADPDTKINNLSGGERTRLAIAYAVKPWDAPDVLLFDEPTNNLDRKALVWLKKIIQQYDGIILLVSHDRALLNVTCDKILYIKDAKATEYAGNYDDFVETRTLEDSQQRELAAAAKKQKRLLKTRIQLQRNKVKAGSGKHSTDNDKMARSFFANRTGRTAGRMLQALENKLAKVDDVQGPRKIIQYRASLGGHVDSKKLVMRMSEVSFAYDNNKLIRNLSFELRGGQWLHVMGDNGTGKSTLLRLAATKLKPLHGEIKYGTSVKVGYYAQDADQLMSKLSLYEQLGVRTKDEETALFENGRALGLTPKILETAVGKLSRGQRSKVAILELLMNNYDLLILDEPTNHLDIRTRAIFEEALSRYEGAVLFASHDNYFVEKMSSLSLRSLLLKKEPH